MRVGFLLMAGALLFGGLERAGAWGRDGHDIVAAIAESRLTSPTLETVHRILRSTEPLAAVSVWADDVRPQRRQTAPWHYVDYPIHTDGLDLARCPNGDCVTEIIGRLVHGLTEDPEAPALEQEERLKFLVHFVGDQSQPLHNANEHGDRGGNDKRVVFFGRSANLHSIWDTQILRRYLLGASLTTQQGFEMLNAEIRPEQVRIWTMGGPRDWTHEANRLAIDFAYPGWSEEISEDYYLKSIGVMRVQLQKGGVRLAHVLNRAFDPGYDGVPVVRRDARIPAARRLGRAGQGGDGARPGDGATTGTRSIVVEVAED